MDADTLIDLLGLQPHPEGGWYGETWRAPSDAGERPASTGIYFLLKAGERSHWHRVDADELWLFHAGDPLRLSISSDGERVDDLVLGQDLEDGQHPQAVVPTGRWQAAEPLGEWTLVSCVVAPGFSFEGFELAPPGWRPGRSALDADRGEAVDPILDA
jgi:predicted cupin superfamily sugar epimerase